MEPGEGCSTRRPGGGRPACPWLGLCLALLAGCATPGPGLDQALQADHQPPAPAAGLAEYYVVHCPDVLDLRVDGRPDLTGERAVGPDGRIDLGDGGRVRVDGQTVSAGAQRVAEEADVPPDRVQLRVVEFNSQQVYLFGQVHGLQRAIPYRGPETVVELLQRAGGVTPGAAPHEIYVVRSHLAEGGRPEVFRIDLHAILARRDQHTNLHVQPFDQVYIGESRQASLERCVPPCLRPFYESMCGLRRPTGRANGPPPPGTENQAGPPAPQAKSWLSAHLGSSS
jgi:protein involved in polysaccharide export with SLBB domain